MALNAVRQLRQLSIVRYLSAAAPELKHGDVQVRRTQETKASNHSKADLYKFYTLPEHLKSELFELGGIPKVFKEQSQIFNEAAILVRSCMVELVGYLKQVDKLEGVPSPRFVVYGEGGVGKSLTLMHALQYAQENGQLIVHIPWALKWFAYPKEVSLSTTKEGMVDLNIDAAMWLRHFQLQNKKLLEDPKLTTSREYVWSPREKSEVNIPLRELVEHGISRVKYASDVVDALFQEVKILSTQGVCRTFVCVDGYNCFFTESSNCRPEDKSKVPPSRVTLTQSVLNLVQSDWSNGSIVLGLSPRANLPNRRASHLPLYILKKEGFESIDPFVPIHVPELNSEEFHNLLNLYEDKKWLQFKHAREEIAFVTKQVAQKVYEYCSYK
uniref:Small ribosomal subunit protein mS29 n=1 Tax=Cacopsylla melanoneura TaxID=428564 RepID=A0A8D9AT63_9HEMI